MPGHRKSIVSELQKIISEGKKPWEEALALREEKAKFWTKTAPFFDAHTRGAEGFFARVCASKKWPYERGNPNAPEAKRQRKL